MILHLQPLCRNLRNYLEFLINNGSLSMKDLHCILPPLINLQKIIPQLDEDIVNKVRNEMGKTDFDPFKLRNQEFNLWHGDNPFLIPGFDGPRESAHFYARVPLDNVPNLIFLNKQAKDAHQHTDFNAVKIDIEDCEMFFFVILRMFRYQYAKNQAS